MVRSFLQAVGSLWLAAVILILLMIAMGAATVYESHFGSPAALKHFYKAEWFQFLLALLAVNAFAGIIARYPWSFRQIGFLCTHGSILVILIGAWVTYRWGIDGQVVLSEGRPTSVLTVFEPVLRIKHQGGDRSAERKLDGKWLDRLESGQAEDSYELRLDDVSVRPVQYFADSQEMQQVLDDNPQPQIALEAALTSQGQEAVEWLFPDEEIGLGMLSASLRVASSEEELKNLLTPPSSQPAQEGSLSVTWGGQSAVWPLSECVGKTLPIPGLAGGTLTVLQYLPHATVDSEQGLRSASDEPVNPAVQVELRSGEFSARKWAFSKFPSFWSEAELGPLAGLKVTLAAGDGAASGGQIQVVSGPAGQLFLRFMGAAGFDAWQPVAPGQAVSTPWSNVEFVIRQKFDHARIDRYVKAIDPPRENPEPALGLHVTTGSGMRKMLLVKSETKSISGSAGNYTLSFAEQTYPLDGRLILDRFIVGRYPGTQRPRSFESHVRFQSAGQEISRVISMNNPALFGSYNFYQSSYQQDPRTGKTVSVLSVSWDPGQPVVFAGYGLLMFGMLWVLVLRSLERRRAAPPGSDAALRSATANRATGKAGVA